MKSKAMEVQPVTLTGQHVRLEPLTMDHLDALWDIGHDADLWQWTPYHIKTREEMRTYIQLALDWQEIGTALPFVTIEQETDRGVGSTRFGNIDIRNRRVEIGWTWIGKPWQRTAVNTEAKFLMLQHAFEVWHCIRVELKTDVLNERSRAAIVRIGAKQEGIFRHHIITDSGRLRDTIYFSIINDEWPEVKARLQTKLTEPLVKSGG
jgi:RimJ/RimL family protein N-acetyltransferase